MQDWPQCLIGFRYLLLNIQTHGTYHAVQGGIYHVKQNGPYDVVQGSTYHAIQAFTYNAVQGGKHHVVKTVYINLQKGVDWSKLQEAELSMACHWQDLQL